MNTVKTADYSMPFYEEILDFLAAAPSVVDIAGFRPRPEAQNRFSDLVEANRTRKLSLSEEEELDHYIRIERMMALLKAKAYSGVRA